jgi:hypothetical protein
MNLQTALDFYELIRTRLGSLAGMHSYTGILPVVDLFECQYRRSLIEDLPRWNQSLAAWRSHQRKDRANWFRTLSGRLEWVHYGHIAMMSLTNPRNVSQMLLEQADASTIKSWLLQIGFSLETAIKRTLMAPTRLSLEDLVCDQLLPTGMDSDIVWTLSRYAPTRASVPTMYVKARDVSTCLVYLHPTTNWLPIDKSQRISYVYGRFHQITQGFIVLLKSQLNRLVAPQGTNAESLIAFKTQATMIKQLLNDLDALMRWKGLPLDHPVFHGYAHRLHGTEMMVGSRN